MQLYTYYYLFFAILLSFVLCQYALNKDIPDSLKYFIFLFFILFIGLRVDSVDYVGYKSIYEGISFKNISWPLYSGNRVTGREFLFATMISIFKLIGLPFQVFIFSIALLSVYLKFSFFKKYSPYFLLSVLIYMTMMFFKDLGQIRNALSASILLFAAYFLKDKNPVRFIFAVFAAAGFQVFTFVALPLYLLHRYFSQSRFLYSLLSLSLLIALTGGITQYILPFFEVFGDKFYSKVANYYFGEKNIDIDFSLFNTLHLGLAYAFVALRSKIKDHNEIFRSLVTMYAYGVSLYFFFFDFSMIAGRSFETFCALSLCILLPMIAAHLTGLKKHLFLAALLSYTFLVFYANEKHANVYSNLILN